MVCYKLCIVVPYSHKIYPKIWYLLKPYADTWRTSQNSWSNAFLESHMVSSHIQTFQHFIIDISWLYMPYTTISYKNKLACSNICVHLKSSASQEQVILLIINSQIVFICCFCCRWIEEIPRVCFNPKIWPTSRLQQVPGMVQTSSKTIWRLWVRQAGAAEIRECITTEASSKG